MSWWCFLIVFLSLFQTCFLSSPSPQLCLHDERYALLQFKQKHYAVNSYANYYHPLKSWNKPNTDCCYWEGITCDGTAGHVIGLDLTDSSLNGSIHSNSNLFHLRHLRMLNLSWNQFDYFAPSGFDRLSRLMHLNLSGNHFSGQIPSQIAQLIDLVSLDLSSNGFGGQIPSEISQLTKLVFLDFSGHRISQFYIYPSFSQLEIPNLRAFVQNLSRLRELRLDGVDLSAQKNRDWCHHLSSALPNLHVLSMSNCSLTGPLDASISSLHFLSELYLALNQNLSSTVPTSLVNLTSLTVLSLQYCGFHGDFPTNVFLQPNLKYIDLSENPLLSAQLPEFPQVNNTLQHLGVGSTKFQGKLPNSIGNLKFLKELNLWNCDLSGLIPPSLANLTYLTKLDLSNNSFRGQISSISQARFPNLKELVLGQNLLQGHIHSQLFSLPSLYWLDLSGNQFSGVINEPIHNISSFSSLREFGYFNLSGNYLEGQELMRSISKINAIISCLDLSFNDFGYMVEDTNLSYDGLPVNGSGDNFVNAQILELVMSACNLSKFPDFLRNQKELRWLDLSHNKISKFPDFLRDLKLLNSIVISSNRIDGAIPKWIWQNNLYYLNLSDNFLIGLELPLPTNYSFTIGFLDLQSNMIQECLSTAPCSLQTFNQSNSSEFVSPILGNLSSLLSETYFFSISDNNLSGKIPFSICNASNLSILDLSKNQLSGTIPTCLGHSNLGVLNLESNKLHGHIPPMFRSGCSLHTLKLNGNMLQGQVPRSLANCRALEVLDIGVNQLNGTFPYWLENLFELRVLVMRSNNFSGPILQLSHVDSPFPSLHVFDISFNAFMGNLPLQYILHWKGMTNDEANSELHYISYNAGGLYYRDTITIVDKGISLEMGSILTAFTTLDLSYNKFSGGIPDAMGSLKSLILLNLSGNSLTGQIPSSLKNLTKLESLDLSRNNLSGQIPSQLTSLTSLAILNLSYNNLTGNIPQGNQFGTFLNASYEGNLGLCGFPLSKKCGITDGASPPILTLQQEEDSTCVLDRKFVIAGYCSGLTIGVVIGQQLFWRNNQFIAFCLRIRGSKKRKGLKRKHHRRRK
ncbi:receptor like protein 24-like [Macadamia integrifolia]|uniref:receptor like protein 24-like n=1 Tax=Macadamia integrifolia TaxID=60698 RepID=UPI001C52806B|nr:receptor like protein 24-like [Macadamia integrifolia]